MFHMFLCEWPSDDDNVQSSHPLSSLCCREKVGTAPKLKSDTSQQCAVVGNVATCS